MIVVLEEKIKKEDKEKIHDFLNEKNVSFIEIKGKFSIIYLDEITWDNMEKLKKFQGILKIYEKDHPFLKASREIYKEDTLIDIKGKKIGKGNFINISGPCSVESKESLFEIASSIKESGGDILRAGTFKLRTSPYSFQGLGNEGLKILIEIGNYFNMPVVSEIVDPRQIEDFLSLDIIQVGARNMKNYELLKELGKINKPIILKRGMDATIDELLQSAEYILIGGNENVILCERGIRTFEKRTRNTLDLSSVQILKELSHLPVIVDPSHGVGIRRFVKSLSFASAAIGADGLMIESHNNPDKALSDNLQQVDLEEYRKILLGVRKILELNIYED